MTDGEVSPISTHERAPNEPPGNAVIFTSSTGHAQVKLTSTNAYVSFFVAHWTVHRDSQAW